MAGIDASTITSLGEWKLVIPLAESTIAISGRLASHALMSASISSRCAAGSASIFDPTLDRAVRDLNVARHHLQLQAHVMEDVGRVMLGQAPRNPLF